MCKFFFKNNSATPKYLKAKLNQEGKTVYNKFVKRKSCVTLMDNQVGDFNMYILPIEWMDAPVKLFLSDR